MADEPITLPLANAGERMMRVISVASLLMTGFGDFAGATMPVQLPITNSL